MSAQKRHSNAPCGAPFHLSFLMILRCHLKSYPCPKNMNFLWNQGFLLGITMLLQILTGIFLGLYYTPDINSAYSSVMHILREVYFCWSFRSTHSSGASFLYLSIFIHLGRALSFGSVFYLESTDKEKKTTNKTLG